MLDLLLGVWFRKNEAGLKESEMWTGGAEVELSSSGSEELAPL